MGDLFSSGVSALLAFQRTLGATSNNIANANREGYSRQVVEFASRPSQYVGFVGNGVRLQNIGRLHDEFITSQVQSVTREQSRLEIFSNLSSQFNNLCSDEAGGLSPSMQRFFESLQDVASDPASTSSR